MGGSDDPNSKTKAIDASVGGLVWVRRRNGSWWPGQIMGLDEITEGSVISPKSGTPVKLLGRLDATVDWYNLEKSKRVKAFRCGEYDECIEKAKSAAANGNKKAVKYARREDAILHALEIENTRRGKDCLDVSRTNNSSVELVNSAKESPSMSLSGKLDNEDLIDDQSDSGDGIDSDCCLRSDSGLGSDSVTDSAPELSQSGISFEEPNHIGFSKVQSLQGKRRTPNDSEDDGTEGIRRMRGLEDLGMGVADSNAGNCMYNGSPGNGSRGHNSLKRKRSQVANIHELLKRKNRSRPLTKVMESTATVSIPVACNQLPCSSDSLLQGLWDCKFSEIESNESTKHFSMVSINNTDNAISCENGASLNPSEHPGDASHIDCNVKENDVSVKSGYTDNDNSNRLLDVPFAEDKKNSADVPPFFVSSSGRQQVGGRASQSSEAEAVCLKNEGINESVSTSSTAVHVSIGQRMEKGTSKWQLKGKRNSRHKSKSRKQVSRKYVATNVEADDFLAGLEQKVNRDGSRKFHGLRNCNLQVKSRPFAEDPANGVWEWSKSLSHREPQVRRPEGEVSLLPQRSLPYRQSRFTINSRYRTSDFPVRNFGTYSKLYDVELEVKASYQPPHVPLVSLTSKMSGKAIVGHSLIVERLCDGCCDDMVGDECNATHPSALATADVGYAVQNSGSGRNPAKHMTVPQRVFPSKSRRPKKSVVLSKKIRKLSSLTGNKENRKKPVLEKSRGPVIACIPLKLVFSRINEAVNGSAARQAHRATTSSNS